MKLLYSAPFLENSGYGEAARNYAKALHSVGVELTAKNIDYQSEKAKLKPDDEAFLRSILGKKVAYDRTVTHSVPEHWPNFMEQGKKNFGWTVWETSVTPPQWTPVMNGPADRIIVPSVHTMTAIKAAQVRKDIAVVPIPLDVTMFDKPEEDESLTLMGIAQEDFKFLASSQFTERKNFIGLIKAYYHAFHGVNNVVLILKTYMQKHDAEDQARVMGIINGVKQSMNMPNFPRIVLLNSIFTDKQMVVLNRFSDANVMLHRGEGWGMSQMEAALAGKPVIATNYGGISDFLDKDTAYLVDYSLTPVFNMWGWYQGNQMWAEPDMGDAIKKMRNVFMLRKKSQAVGEAARKNIIHNFNYERVGRKMQEALS